MNIATLGNTIYSAVKDDRAACAKILEELGTLALAIATDPNAAARITSATVNGQTFTAQSAISNLDRLKMLRWVAACINNGGPISTVQATSF